MTETYFMLHILSLLQQMILHCLVEAKADTCVIGSLRKGYYIEKYIKLTSTDPIRMDFQCQYLLMSICNSNDRNIFHLIHIMLLLILLILHCLVEAKADTCVIGSLRKGYYIEKYIKLTSTDPIRNVFQCQYFLMSICNNNGKIFHVKHILSLLLQMILHALVKAKEDTRLIGSLCNGYYI
jgi:hypothetical protein